MSDKSLNIEKNTNEIYNLAVKEHVEDIVSKIWELDSNLHCFIKDSIDSYYKESKIEDWKIPWTYWFFLLWMLNFIKNKDSSSQKEFDVYNSVIENAFLNKRYFLFWNWNKNLGYDDDNTVVSFEQIDEELSYISPNWTSVKLREMMGFHYSMREVNWYNPIVDIEDEFSFTEKDQLKLRIKYLSDSNKNLFAYYANKLFSKTLDSSSSTYWPNITKWKIWILDHTDNKIVNESQLSLIIANEFAKWCVEKTKFDYINEDIRKRILESMTFSEDSYFIDNMTFIYIYKILYLFGDYTKQFNFIYNLKKHILKFVSINWIKPKTQNSKILDSITSYQLSEYENMNKFADYLISIWILDSKYWKDPIMTEYISFRDRTIWAQHLALMKNLELISTSFNEEIRFSEWYTNIDSIINLFLFEKNSFTKNNYIIKELRVKY